MKLLHLKVVLAAIDTDESSIGTLGGAWQLADAAGARLDVVHAIPTAPHTDQNAEAAAVARANAARQLLDRSGLDKSKVRLDIVRGDPTHVIRSHADKIKADVIVLGELRGPLVTVVSKHLIAQAVGSGRL
jgi:nucleotide-binding universal stress UspA family protein